MSTEIQETINRLRELDQKASPAPWLATHSDYLETVEDGGVVIEDAGGEVIAEADVDLGHHSFFINDALPLMVELRNALPVLLTEIERLTAENKKLAAAENKKLAAAEFNETRDAVIEDLAGVNALLEKETGVHDDRS